MTAVQYYFVIVGEGDRPLYELEQTKRREDLAIAHEDGYLHQFIVHAALDCVDDLMWRIPQSYLKNVDQFNEWMISSYITPSNGRFMLLHTMKQDDAIRLFFNETHELYIKVSNSIR
jgi:hypothetical protein